MSLDPLTIDLTDLLSLWFMIGGGLTKLTKSSSSGPSSDKGLFYAEASSTHFKVKFLSSAILTPLKSTRGAIYEFR